MRRTEILLVVLSLLLLALPAMAQDPTEVDSKHYKVVFENDQVRVLRITYGPPTTRSPYSCQLEGVNKNSSGRPYSGKFMQRRRGWVRRYRSCLGLLPPHLVERSRSVYILGSERAKIENLGGLLESLS